MPGQIYDGDAVTIRKATERLLREGTLAVPENIARQFGDRGQYFVENPRDGRWYSKYGIANIFAYVPPLAAEQLMFGDDDVPAAQQYLRRLTFLNAYNVVLALLLAVYLFRIAEPFSDSRRHTLIFVFVAVFGTFLWNYLRAQTVEIFQVLAFTAACHHLFAARRAAHAGLLRQARRHQAALIGFLGWLILSKSIYVLVLPLVAAYQLLDRGDDRDRSIAETLRANFPSTFKRLVLPCSGIVCLLLLANWYSFGDPLATGYAQWERERHLFSWNLLPGVSGYLTDVRKSVLLFFPLLIPAVIGFRVFRRRFPAEATFLAAVAGLFLIVNAAFINWRGDWCFGPRYLLFALPLVSLPALEVFRWGSSRAFWKFAVLAFVVAVTARTFVVQAFVTPVAFFAHAHSQAICQSDDPAVAAYFAQPEWVVQRDLANFVLRSRPFPPLEALAEETPRKSAWAAAELKAQPFLNVYWLTLASHREAAEVESVPQVGAKDGSRRRSKRAHKLTHY